MKITAAQMNPIVGAIEDNTRRVLDIARDASKAGADLVVFPELVLTGYPPKDLLERPGFIDHAGRAVEQVREASTALGETGIIVGCPRRADKTSGKGLNNNAILVAGGRILFEQTKMLLPTYDVFDEARYFAAAEDNAVCEFKGVRLGLSICEDLWFEPDPWNRRPYPCDPIELLAEKDVHLLINISASPFSLGKDRVRHELITNHTRRHGVPFLFVNQVGGNDDLVFDGTSLFVNDSGDVCYAAPSFESATFDVDTDGASRVPYAHLDDMDAIHRALVLGTRDYIGKCGFPSAVIGLSGGVDSAVTAAIAARAIGADNCLGVAMPSPFSSPESLQDAEALATNLGIKFEVVPIAPLMSAYDEALARPFAQMQPDETEENIQARIRGNIIMAFSNKFGYLPLSTGNKSELSVGYCTLYGDMSGGLAVISDVPKTMVYGLARHINGDRTVIPQRTIDRVPSAELKPDQTDQDTLPPYDVLDAILEQFVDRNRSAREIIAAGYDDETVRWVLTAVTRNEYKRRQAAPGIKVMSKAFGTGRRFPIAARYDL